MSKFTKLALVISLSLIAHYGFSQWSIAPSARLFNMVWIKTPGIGLNVEYGVANDDGSPTKFVYAGGLNFYFPTKTTYEEFAYPFEGDQGSFYIDVEESNSAYNLSAYIKYYFIGNYDASKFGSYLKFGSGYTYVPFNIKITDKDYDPEEAYTTIHKPKGAYKGMVFDLGLGIEGRISPNMSLFGYAGVFLPANEANGQAITVELGGGTILSLGARFNLGNGSGGSSKSSGRSRTKSKGFGQSKAYKAAKPKGSTNRKPKKSKRYKSSRKPSRKSFRFN